MSNNLNLPNTSIGIGLIILPKELDGRDDIMKFNI